jgi:adenylosuccinate lyase
VLQKLQCTPCGLSTIDWRKFGGTFVEENLGYTTFPTTQIEHYDHFAAFFDALKE